MAFAQATTGLSGSSNASPLGNMSPNTIPQGSHQKNGWSNTTTRQTHGAPAKIRDGGLTALPTLSISRSWHDWPVAWRDVEGDVVMVDYEDGDVVMSDPDGQVVIF